MNTTDLLVSERGREREQSLSPSFPSPCLPFCFHLLSHVTKALSLRQTGFEIALLFSMHLRLHDVNPFIIFKNYILFSNLVIMSCLKMSFCIILYVYFNLFTVNITQFNPRVAKLYSINYLSHLSSFFIFFGVHFLVSSYP